MEINFYDSDETEYLSKSIQDYQGTPFLVIVQDLMLELNSRLSALIKASSMEREALAKNFFDQLAQLQTINQEKKELGHVFKWLITADSNRLQKNQKDIQFQLQFVKELIKAPRELRSELIEQFNEVTPAPLPTTIEMTREVDARRNEIRELLEKTRDFLKPSEEIEQCATGTCYNRTYEIEPSRLIPIEDGISGSYFLMDSSDTIRFVVKPVDEDISCLHNPKGFGGVGYDNLFDTKLYRSVFRENAVYAMANAIGVSSIAPKVTLAILNSDLFFDIAKKNPTLGPQETEKLCSCMEFIPNAKSVFEAVQELQQIGLTDDEIEARFDQADFEDVNILLWGAGERDGHGGNIFTYVKGYDVVGNEILGLKKIDNGLALPEADTKQLYNSLIYLPGGRRPLSEAAIEKILSIDTDVMAQIQRDNRLEESVAATTARIERLKAIIIANPNLSIKEIHQRLCHEKSL